jgi:hypothetical protein
MAIKAIQMHSSFHDMGCFWKHAGKTDKGPVPVDGQLAKLFEAYDVFLTLFPSSTMVATIRYRKASDLEACNHFREAAELYRQVYEGNPDRELVRYARAGYRRAHRREGKTSGARDHGGVPRKVDVP